MAFWGIHNDAKASRLYRVSVVGKLCRNKGPLLYPSCIVSPLIPAHGRFLMSLSFINQKKHFIFWACWSSRLYIIKVSRRVPVQRSAGNLAVAQSWINFFFFLFSYRWFGKGMYPCSRAFQAQWLSYPYHVTQGKSKAAFNKSCCMQEIRLYSSCLLKWMGLKPAVTSSEVCK